MLCRQKELREAFAQRRDSDFASDQVRETVHIKAWLCHQCHVMGALISPNAVADGVDVLQR